MDAIDDYSPYFRHGPYLTINKMRQDIFNTVGLPIFNSTILETGAGIGDMTSYLISQGARHVYVNEVREKNLSFLRDKFNDHRERITILPGNLETCLVPGYCPPVDLVFSIGTIYHLRDPFKALVELAQYAPILALETQFNSDNMGVDEDASDLSQSFSGRGFRPSIDALQACLLELYPYLYRPIENPTDRTISISSRTPLTLTGVTSYLDSWPGQ